MVCFSLALSVSIYLTAGHALPVFTVTICYSCSAPGPATVATQHSMGLGILSAKKNEAPQEAARPQGRCFGMGGASVVDAARQSYSAIPRDVVVRLFTKCGVFSDI